MANPYQSPTLLETATANEGENTTLGFEFEADWSPQGIRKRRRHPMHSLADTGLALLTLVWLGSLLGSVGGIGTGALACLLTPAWMISGLFWLVSVSYRNGGTFLKSCRALSGRVHGRVDAGFIALAGPSLNLATQTHDCLQSHWSHQGAAFRPPLVGEVLPVVQSDVTHSWPSQSPVQRQRDPQTLIDRLLEISDPSEATRISGSGQLRGNDFRHQTTWRRWTLAAAILGLSGAACLVWGLLRYHALPPWLIQPPAHYVLSDRDVGQWLMVVGINSIAVALLVASAWQFRKRLISYGDYFVTFTPKMVVLSNAVIALGYHHQSLQHFKVTPTGLAILDRSKAPVFMIPFRWFSSEDAQRVKQWFDQTEMASEPSGRSYYIGPRI